MGMRMRSLHICYFVRPSLQKVRSVTDEFCDLPVLAILVGRENNANGRVLDEMEK
jgi:hypothetical protein